MSTLDPRLAARRRHVRETWARRRLRWVLALVAAVLVAALCVGLLESPWLALRSVQVEGEVNAATVADVLADAGVTVGAPTVAVRPGSVEAALEQDPWIAHADVTVTWPGAVEVLVVERHPAAWVRTDGSWALVAVDGVVLELAAAKPAGPVLRSDVGPVEVGDRIADPTAAGAIEFLGRLPATLAAGAVAQTRPSGINAVVADHRVLVGSHRDVPAKVATLLAILEAGIEDGSVVNVISPTRPGVTHPQPQVEGTGEDVSLEDGTG